MRSPIDQKINTASSTASKFFGNTTLCNEICDKLDYRCRKTLFSKCNITYYSHWIDDFWIMFFYFLIPTFDLTYRFLTEFMLCLYLHLSCTSVCSSLLSLLDGSYQNLDHPLKQLKHFHIVFYQHFCSITVIFVLHAKTMDHLVDTKSSLPFISVSLKTEKSG